MNKSESTGEHQDEPAPQSAAELQTRFAWLRTRMALQTTLAAWVRTATSLIGFGFVIVQFIERLGNMDSARAARSAHLARIIGLVLIAAGSLTTAVAIWEYRLALNYLQSHSFRHVAGLPTVRREPPDVAVWMAVLVCCIGVLAFAMVLITTEPH